MLLTLLFLVGLLRPVAQRPLCRRHAARRLAVAHRQWLQAWAEPWAHRLQAWHRRQPAHAAAVPAAAARLPARVARCWARLGLPCRRRPRAAAADNVTNVCPHLSVLGGIMFSACFVHSRPAGKLESTVVRAIRNRLPALKFGSRRGVSAAALPQSLLHHLTVFKPHVQQLKSKMSRMDRLLIRNRLGRFVVKSTSSETLDGRLFWV